MKERLTAYGTICLLFFSTVFSGAMLWRHCIIPTLLLIALIIINFKNLNTGVSLTALVFIALGALSLFYTKGDFQNGLYEMQKALLFVMALLLGTLLTSKTVTRSIYYSAIPLAMIGLTAYCFFVTSHSLTALDSGLLRLQSTTAYANTTAVYLALGYISSIEEQRTGKFLHRYFGALLLMAMYLTLSKGAIPVFMVAGLLLIIKDKESAGIFVTQNLYALAFLIPIIFTASKGMAFFTVALLVVYIFLSGKSKSMGDKLSVTLWWILIAVGAVGGGILIKLMPSLFSTFRQRLMYVGDSIKLFKSSPLIGTGQGSWELLQFQTQSYQYDVKYIHNGFLQYLTENGIFFTLLFCSVIVFAIIRSLKHKHFTIASMLVLMTLHSLIDFDFSYGAVLIALGLFCSAAFKDIKSPQLVKNSINTILCTVLVANSLYMATEFVLRDSFEGYCASGEYEKALEASNSLEALCGRDSNLQISIGAVLEQTGAPREQVLERIDKARQLSPNDPDIFKFYAEYNLSAENLEKLCFDYIRLKPKNEITYETAKALVQKALTDGYVDGTEAEALIEKIDTFRTEQKVYDRNELLDRLKKRRTQ